MVVAYLGVILFGAVGVYYYYSSQTAATESRVRENVAGAQTAAEYAAEIAIANLSQMEYGTNSDGVPTVLKDWVKSNPYGSSGMEAAERRIAGLTGRHNEFEYRVSVRSVRDVKLLQETSNDPNVPHKGWLSHINPPAYAYGSESMARFNNAYEIISTARRAGDHNPATLGAEGSVRTVVNLKRGGLGDGYPDYGVLGLRVPWTLKGAATMSRGLVNDANIVNVSGEDHYAVKAAVKDPVEEEVIEGLANIKAAASELYSVVNYSHWDLGRLTLHYQVQPDAVNPQIPRTVGFEDSNSGNAYRNTGLNQQMTTFDPSRPYDQYVFGGKQADREFSLPNPATGATLMYLRGRSVSLLPDNTIKEKLQREAEPGSNPGDMTETVLAVGKAENILKLYLNFLPNTPPAKNANEAAINNWRSTWTQMSLGYHSRAATRNSNSSSITPQTRPLDNRNSSARRRWATLIWIKNEEGQFLVREYETGKYAQANKNQELPDGDAWYGTYRWMYYGGFYNPGKYHFGSFLNPSSYSIGSRNNYRKALHARFLTIEELMGEQMTKGSDGLPAKLQGGVVVPGVPDFEVDHAGERIPYDPDGTGTQFDEAYQRQVRSDNYGVSAATLSSMPPTDGIYVLVDNPSDPADWISPRTGKRYKRHQTLRDFAYERNIAADGEPEDLRELASLHMVLEFTPEEQPPSNSTEGLYFDMGLTVTIVFPKIVGGGPANNDEFLTDKYKQWWEGEADESLTGKRSHYPVFSFLPSVTTIPQDNEEDMKKAFYELFGVFKDTDPEAPYPYIYTMVDPASEHAGFGKAVFLNGGALDDTSKDNAVDKRIYYGYDQLYEIYSMDPGRYKAQVFWESLTDAERDAYLVDGDAYRLALDEWREKLAVAFMKEKNPGYSFFPLEQRFENENKRHRVELSKSKMATYNVPDKRVDARYFSLEAFGYKTVDMPAAYAKSDGGVYERLRMSDVQAGGGSSEIPVFSTTVPMLPGELIPDTDSVESSGEYVPLMSKTRKEQANGRPITPRIIWKETNRPLPEMDMRHLHDFPEWFRGVHDNYPEHTGYRNGNLVTALLQQFPDEHRGAIGWHREGPNPDPADTGTLSLEDYKLTYGDHYEFVILSEKEYMPYETIRSGGKTYLAVTPPESAEGVYAEGFELSDCRPKLKDPANMPTFIFAGKEIDGAGILVVNGNLEIRTKFAYHGTLVVMGNIEVYKGDRKVPVTNADGEVVDSDGNVLTGGGDSGLWYYIEDGVKKYSSPTYEWPGDLVVQGRVYVGGEIRTSPGHKVGEFDVPPAVVDIRGSRQALEETTGTWVKAGPNEKFEVERLGWSSNTGQTTVNLW